MKFDTNRLKSDLVRFIDDNPHDVKALQIMAYLIYSKNRNDKDEPFTEFNFICQDNRLVRVKLDISKLVKEKDLRP